MQGFKIFMSCPKLIYRLLIELECTSSDAFSSKISEYWHIGINLLLKLETFSGALHYQVQDYERRVYQFLRLALELRNSNYLHQ